MAAENGADCIRINPGNIGSELKVKEVVNSCKHFGIPIRIGVNSGSISFELLDKYNIAKAARDIEEFVKELSQWYIRRSRNRFKKGDVDALGTLHYVLVQLSKILSPFVPFLSEEIYQNIVVNLNLKEAKESVHLEEYP